MRYEHLPTGLVESRNVDVWLPPEYDLQPEQRFPVLYMHDGQNLFDASIAFTGHDWGVDESIVRLTQAGKIRPAVVVGVWNIEKRWLDYIPQKPVETPQGEAYRQEVILKYGELSASQVTSDRYLRFLVSELKPFIDQQFRSLPGREDTFIMGSSMGGLASLYALCEYPQVFCAAGCLSTHWPALGGLCAGWVDSALPPAGQHKIYFDYGTETLDALYEPYQLQVDAVMRSHGYAHGVDWITRKFPGAEHNEAAWRKRLDIPMEFLLG